MSDENFPTWGNLPWINNGSDFGNHGVFNTPLAPSPQQQQAQIDALVKQLAQVQAQPAPPPAAPAPAPQAPPPTTPRPNAWSMANFTSDQDTPVGTDYRAGNIPYQWFQPQPAGQLQPGQGGVQPPAPPPGGPSAGGLPSFGPGQFTPLGGDPAGASAPAPGVQNMAAALAGQPSGEAMSSFGAGTGRVSDGFLRPPAPPPPDPGVPPSLPSVAPDPTQTQQLAMALMGGGDPSGQGLGGPGQAIGAQNDSMMGGMPDQAMQSAFGTDFMGRNDPAFGAAPGLGQPTSANPANAKGAEPTFSEQSFNDTQAAAAAAAAAAQAGGVPSPPGLGPSPNGPNYGGPQNTGWGATVTNVAGVPTGLQPGQPAPTQAPTPNAVPGPSVANVQAALAAQMAQTTPAPAPAPTPAPPASVVPSLPSPAAAPSAASGGADSAGLGPAGENDPSGLGAGSGTGLGPGQGSTAAFGGMEHGNPNAPGVGVDVTGMAHTGVTLSGENGFGGGVGVGGGDGGGGGVGSGPNGVGNPGDAGSGTPGAGQSGEGGQWALGGIIPHDGDAQIEAVPNQTLHETEGVVNPGGMELLGEDFINELNAIALDESLDDEAKADAAKDLFARLAAGEIEGGGEDEDENEGGDSDMDDADDAPAVPPGTMAQAPKPIDPKRKLAMAMMPQRPPMAPPMQPQQGMMG